MDGLIFLMIVFVVALMALPILAAFAVFVVGVSRRLGLLRPRWSFRLAAAAGMALPPAIWLYLDRVAAARCQAAVGPDAVSCGGELGGAFFFLFQSMLILGGLIVGPILGGRLHARWTEPWS